VTDNDEFFITLKDFLSKPAIFQGNACAVLKFLEKRMVEESSWECNSTYVLWNSTTKRYISIAMFLREIQDKLEAELRKEMK
jgi:hypothetical protein